MSKESRRLQIISRRLTTHQLRRLQGIDIPFDYTNFLGRDISQRSSPYFLGYYSCEGIEYALETYGFFSQLRKRGLDNFILVVNTEDPYKQRIALYYNQKDSDHLLGELVVKRKNITINPPFPSRVLGRNFEVISVEWLCLQNPEASFTPDRPRLPGQKYPGLKMGSMVMELLIIMCGRLRTAGLLNIPEHFHNAQMYAPQFRFIDPLYAGKQKAIARDLLPKYHLADVSWAIDLKCVTENRKPFEWFISEQIIPLDRDLKEYFNNKSYVNYVNKVAEQYRYEIDEEKWNVKKQEIDYFKGS